jgi:DNA-binding beta-propeller fold protein YncE
MASQLAGFPVLPPAPALEAPLLIEIENRHIVADPVRAAIYASVPASQGIHGNRVIRIDPTTGAVTGDVLVGADPDRLAISDDGQFLYVALRGASSVVRVRLSDLSVHGTLQMPVESFYGSLRAEDIEVVPGRPLLLAVSVRNECCSPRHMGVFLYSDTTRLAASTQGHTGSNRITVGSSTELWGYTNESTDFGFRRIRIDSDGLREVQSSQLFQGFGLDLESSGARAFTNSGIVVNPGSMSVVGSIPGGWETVIRPDVATSRVHLLNGGTLSTYNWSSLLSIGSASVPDAAGLTTLIRWGTDGLAMGGGARIVIVRGSLVGP